ncbi:MAG: hypothetical protein MMC33_000549 [Icmadophila ericetorum]|nr:hypothetical protein [Icmadophila ericetorum]
MKTGVRLKILRRTLRERRLLAQYVHELKVPNLQSDATTFAQEMISIVASIVMTCPNFERLLGFYPIYNHEFDRLTQALSTRPKLKEHAWIIGPNDAITQRSQKQLPPGLMDVDQVDCFIHYHLGWTSLTTLILHSETRGDDQGVLEHDIFIEVFQRLPALRNLNISNFDIDDFNDLTLEHLPPLHSLRLESLQGVTDRGLSRFASASAAQHLQRLSLIHLPIQSLFIIAKLLAHLYKLTKFTLIQEASPTLPTEDIIIFQPVVASNTLEFLHWDIISPDLTATEQLITSIRAAGFPSLRTIRAPSDHEGLLQSVCKPRSQVVLPADKYSTAHKTIPPTIYSYHKLFDARQAAQRRIDEARNTVQFKVVIDEGGIVKQIYDFNGFLGQIGSQIFYSLKPDVLGKEEAIATVAQMRKGDEDGKEGCTGLWNASHHAGKKWWWHRDRPRWRPVELDSFF